MMVTQHSCPVWHIQNGQHIIFCVCVGLILINIVIDSQMNVL